MLRDVRRDAATKQLGHGRALRRADHQKIDSHRRGKIDNRRGSVLAHGVKRDYVDVALAPSLSIEDMMAFASGSSCHLERPSGVPAAVK